MHINDNAYNARPNLYSFKLCIFQTHSCIPVNTEIEGQCVSITSSGAGLGYPCAPFGASVMPFIKHPSEFVVVMYKQCGTFEFLSHFKNVALQKPDAVSNIGSVD